MKENNCVLLHTYTCSVFSMSHYKVVTTLHEHGNLKYPGVYHTFSKLYFNIISLWQLKTTYILHTHACQWGLNKCTISTYAHLADAVNPKRLTVHYKLRVLSVCVFSGTPTFVLQCSTIKLQQPPPLSECHLMLIL